MDWIVGNLDAEQVYMWLYGGAGAGKSTIAQTLAELCAEQKLLLGTFFFSRTDVRRSSHHAFAATIAYHAASSSSDLRTSISTVIEDDPMIFEKSLRIQLMSLLIDPINKLSVVRRRFMPYVIIIDGLDECVDREKQTYILEVLSHVVHKCSIPLRILIASRPEIEIKAAFNADQLRLLSTRLALNDSFNPDDDILRFLVTAFNHLRTTHYLKKLLPADWPGTHILRRLVLNASGQFIYASTVVKYVSSPRDNPLERLDMVLGLGVSPANGNLPFAHMDTLYTHIFLSFTEEDVKHVQRFLGLFIFEKIKSRHLERKIIPLILSLEPAKLDLLIGGLASVLEVNPSTGGMVLDEPTSDYRTSDYRLTHASLADYLLDERRSRQFYINQRCLYTDIARACIGALHTTFPHYSEYSTIY